MQEPFNGKEQQQFNETDGGIDTPSAASGAEEDSSALRMQAVQALRSRDGHKALNLVNAVLDINEADSDAWLIAMQAFQFVLPIEKYKSENELTCARSAIYYAPKPHKYRVRKKVYLFLMARIIDVLKRDEEVLRDGRQLLDAYQRDVYFDSKGASKKMIERDKPVREAVFATFTYCAELFDFIPDSFIRKNMECNRKAAQVAAQWARTYGFLEMRYELYGRRLTKEYIEKGLSQYARYLRAVKGKEDLLSTELPFNIYHLDQLEYIQ